MTGLLILLVSLAFLTGCITVVIEPYWKDDQTEKNVDTPQTSPAANSPVVIQELKR